MTDARTLTTNLAVDILTGSASATVLDPTTIRDISGEVLDENGRIKVLPAAFWAQTTVEERALFGVKHGIYAFPTVELVDYLRDQIGDRKAIEIGAGNGVLAETLGIPATDNMMQAREPYLSVYRNAGQAPVPYGPNVINCPANRAVRQFKPDVVIGCWVTHKFDKNKPELKGNEIGVDELDIWANCRTYIHVGNDVQHKHSALWTKPHDIIYPDWLYSRTFSGARQFIATWTRRNPRR